MGVTKLKNLYEKWKELEKQDEKSQSVKLVKQAILVLAEVKMTVLDTLQEIGKKVNPLLNDLTPTKEEIEKLKKQAQSVIDDLNTNFGDYVSDLKYNFKGGLGVIWDAAPRCGFEDTVDKLNKWRNSFKIPVKDKSEKDENLAQSRYEENVKRYKDVLANCDLLISIYEQAWPLLLRVKQINDGISLNCRDSVELPANWKTAVVDELAKITKDLKHQAKKKHHHTGLTKEQEKLIPAKKALVQSAIEFATLWQLKYKNIYSLLDKFETKDKGWLLAKPVTVSAASINEVERIRKEVQ
ncbi:MAG: hypothetical protein LBR79_06625 [Oscillospiraceae bacterium]|jgi:hypothetical protein|nr:hypothetical protein [Oscillospiraceae bacterium]